VPAMPNYRLYKIKPDGHIDGPPVETAAPDDLTAVSKAKSLVNGHDIEIWQGPRLVAYVVSDETKQTPPPRPPHADQHK
jgi:hypothetical protein